MSEATTADWSFWISPAELAAHVRVVAHSDKCELPSAEQLQRMRARGVTPTLLRPPRESDHEPGSRIGNIVFWGALSADGQQHMDNDCAPVAGLGRGR